MTLTTHPSETRRLELILRQIDSLPTLPAVATRLLSLTASDDADARQIIGVISADQALTAKVLALCRGADLGIRQEARTVHNAVVLLGFNAIRNAVLSVKVFEHFDAAAAERGAEEEGEPGRGPLPRARFDYAAFWQHSLAVAIAAESIAQAAVDADASAGAGVDPAEAFVCGLLHDIGKLALRHVLPRSYGRVIELSALNQGNIAEFERRILGIDHHTAGKRLAEHWQLPHLIQDCIWLHGSAYDTLPRLEHRRMIGLVGLADLLARKQHIGYSGNFGLKQDAAALAEKLGLHAGRLDSIAHHLHEELERRSRALGLENRPSRELYVQSIEAANQALGRLNGALERRSRAASRQAQVLDAIAAFHAQAAPGRGVPEVIHGVAASACTALGEGFYALLAPSDSDPERGHAWLISQYGAEGRPLRSQYIEPPPHAPDLSSLDSSQALSVSMMGILPWIADYLLEAPDLRRVQLLPLGCGWGTAAVLLHDRPSLPAAPLMLALSSTWGAAIAAAAQHDGARRLGEELAQANLALAEAQDRLLATESMARLGEMAAGAAHEMNNPLAVISGRSQLLTMTLSAGSKEQKAAQTIFEQAHRLSDLITSLRVFADPPRPSRKPIDISALLDRTVKAVQCDKAQCPGDKPVYLQIKQELPTLTIDEEQAGQAVAELVLNAAQASPRTAVYVTAQVEPIAGQLVIQVIDDGVGMDAHTLAHAMDPFFSAKKAGRRVGMGLTRAQRITAAHNGRIELRSTPGEGTVAALILPLDSAVVSADR